MSDNIDGNPKAVDDAVFGSADSFFDSLEDDVNGIIHDDVNEAKVTPEMDPNANNQSQETQVSNSSTENQDIDWKKRYSDSSREAQKMQAELNELKPYVPVLDAMKKDSRLVDHVRGYFQKGGDVPTNVKEQLKLDEDFEFDTDEMVNNPNSDSRKVFNSMVDNIVQTRASQIIQQQETQSKEAQSKEMIKREALAFKERHKMDADEFTAFLDTAKQKFANKGRLSFDDMYLLINRASVNQNVANATKEDMLTQMKNVRDIPTSQGGTNNAGNPNASPDDGVFDALIDVDGNLDNMFG